MDTQNESAVMPESEMQKSDEKTISQKDAFLGLIKNHVIVMEEKLNDAKMRYAEASLCDENWTGKYDRKLECKVLEGQIKALMKLDSDVNCMFAA